MRRRLPTNIAIAGLLTAVLLIAGMWTVAVAGGHVESVTRHFGMPTEFRSNHGPWRHHRLLSDLYDYTLIGTTLGVVPVACVGFLVERTRRAEVVAALASAFILVCCAHFPLFD